MRINLKDCGRDDQFHNEQVWKNNEEGNRISNAGTINQPLFNL